MKRFTLPVQYVIIFLLLIYIALSENTKTGDSKRHLAAQKQMASLAFRYACVLCWADSDSKDDLHTYTIRKAEKAKIVNDVPELWESVILDEHILFDAALLSDAALAKK